MQPSLDRFFRNSETGQLKENFIFIVDNGPSEQPSNSMVQMCLVRLCKFLNLDKVVQVSFAEYNSKRNFVERVHPQTNKVLAAHGAFSSHVIHPGVKGPGKPEHQENMEKMAEDVIDCLKSAKFGGQYIEVYRGLKEDNWIFNDEANLKKFLSLSEFSKEVSGMSYRARQTPLAKSLHEVWEIEQDYSDEYWCDYTMLKGEGEDTSSWCDKYTTVIFRKGDDWRGSPQQRIHRQPLPDFVRWVTSNGELHYLPYELRTSLPVGKWDSVAGCYLPSHCLDLAYVLLDKPTGTLLRCLSLLAWVPEEEVVRFFEEKDKDVEKAMQDAVKREQWKEHRLYREKKDTLVSMCKERKLEPSGMKHEIVERLASALNEEKPKDPQLFDGTKMLPKSTKDIAKLPTSYLQSIVRHHGLAPCGTRDDLVLHVSLIANDRKHLCFNRECKMFLDLISVTRELILEERKQSILADSSPIYRHRTHTTPTAPSLSSDRPRYHASVQTEHSVKSRVGLPPNVTMENVHDIFEELIESVSIKRRTDPKAEECASVEEQTTEDSIVDTETINNRAASILQKGTRVSVKTLY